MPFTQYQYRLEVNNNSPGVTSSPVVTYQTLPGLPSSDISLTLVAVTSLSATLVWTPPSRPNGVIQHYNISTATSTQGNNVTTTTTTNVGLVLTYVMTNLVPYTNYTFTVSACTSTGCQAGPSVWRITNEGPPAGMGVPVFPVTNSTSLVINWSPPSSPNGSYRSVIISLISLKYLKTQCRDCRLIIFDYLRFKINFVINLT